MTDINFAIVAKHNQIQDGQDKSVFNMVLYYLGPVMLTLKIQINARRIIV